MKSDGCACVCQSVYEDMFCVCAEKRWRQITYTSHIELFNAPLFEIVHVLLNQVTL